MVELDGDFERSCIDLAESRVSRVTNDLVEIDVVPRRQTSNDWKLRWLEPCFRVKGLLGKFIRINISPYGIKGDYQNHQTWMKNQKGHYSYDFKTWFPLSELIIAENKLTFNHYQKFEKDIVYFARSWPRSVTNVGQNILELKEKHPELIQSIHHNGDSLFFDLQNFPAQKFIRAEIQSCVDEIGRNIPPTPFYGFQINEDKKKNKQIGLIMAGVHAGEDVGELALWEFLNWLLSEEPEARNIRNNYCIHVYPLVNASGRHAGYWRNAPDGIADTNRQWGFEKPDHNCVLVARNCIMEDLQHKNLSWGFDFHAAPGGNTLQIAVKRAISNSVLFLNFANDFLDGYSIGVYGDINATLNDENPANLTTVWMRNVLKASVALTIESSDQSGPISPDIIRPYAVALGKALHKMKISKLIP